MLWSEFLRDYLTFTRKERIGIIVILLLIFLIFFLPKLVDRKISSTPTDIDTSWINSVKKLEIKEKIQRDISQDSGIEDENFAYQYDRNKDDYPKAELFYFDPNTTSAEDWNKLGLKDKTIQTIQKYLSRGGHFRKPEDLQKIYGLHKDQYERLKPYIKIVSNEYVKKYQENPLSQSLNEFAQTKNYIPRYSIIDINTADTSAFISLPGIGSKLAARIVYFREKLGGFYSINQVGETYGLPDSTFQKIKQYLKLENTTIRKININTATIDELKTHPYIKWNLTNPIVAYRNEHGPFAKVEDIKKVMVVTDEIFNEIAPYLIIQ